MYDLNIKNLFNKTTNKKELILLVAEHFDLNPRSVQCNWFSGFYQVPEKYQNRCIKIMQNFIKVESQVLTH
jgi:hypothetical protein